MKKWKLAFTVEGLNLERLLLQAGEKGLHLTGIKRNGPRRLSAHLPEDEMPLLQEMAVQGGWRLTPGRRLGIGCMLQWLRRRWLLAGAVTMALLLTLAGSQIMWRIEIYDAGAYTDDIRRALDEMHICAPMLRAKINPGEIRAALEWRYPRIAWFECGWRGMTLVIRAVEGTMPMELKEAEGPADVVAARDGIVSSIVTRAGTPVVQPGDFVREGDVLIRGEERTANGAVRQVAARGVVMARVWEGASIRMNLLETETVYTGRTHASWTVESPWFPLWQMQKSGFAQQDVSVRTMTLGGFFLPLTLRLETRFEAECTTRMRDLSDVQQEAYEAALRKLYEKVDREESLVDIWGNCSIIEDEILLSVAIGEMLMDIGQQRLSAGMTAPE